MNAQPLTLLGDGIENPANARTLLCCGEMFDTPVAFIDRKALQEEWREAFPGAERLPTVQLEDVAKAHEPLIALENAKNAEEIYGFRAPSGAAPAVMVGNERQGLSGSALGICGKAVQIPMISKTLNCLNVASSAAVGMYYLTRGGGPMVTRNQPSRHRPELMFLAGKDHFELGSAIRSAGAFGWGRIILEDRYGVWFECDRIKRSGGRAAARRGRNPIRLIRGSHKQTYRFDEVVVLTLRSNGGSLTRANLARGVRQLFVMADEDVIDVDTEDWKRLGKRIRFVNLGVPNNQASSYSFRLPASIALAESSRQIGRPGRPGKGRPRRHEPFFDHALSLRMQIEAETIYLDELIHF